MAPPPRTFFLRTYGCQMNEEDSRRLAHLLVSRGYREVPAPEAADAVIVNTCAVRAHAENRALSWLASLARLRPGGTVFCVAGCVAELAGARLLGGSPPVSVVCGPGRLSELPDLLDAAFAGRPAAAVGLASGALAPAAPGDRVSVSIPIARGCGNFCSYCVVPRARGPLRSRPFPDVAAEVAAAAAAGVREVLLLGQNVNEYGRDRGGPSFVDLLESVCATPGILRVRFLTSHPKDVPDRLVSALAVLPNLYRHIHLPVQSGSDRILALMNRRYGSSDYRALAARLREAVPGLRLTSDVIVGFPGETEADFAETLRLVRETRFDELFVFKYSARPGTPAAAMPGVVKAAAIERRHREVLELQDGISCEANRRFLGCVSSVLALRGSARRPGLLVGRTEEGMAVMFPGAAGDIGRIVPVRIGRAGRRYLEGTALTPGTGRP